MKKLLIMAAAAALLAGCTGKGYTIEGDVEGLTGNVKLMEGTATVAETASQEGKFTFKGKIETPVVYTLTSESGRLALLFLENGTKLKITGRIDGNDTDITITGCAAQDALREFRMRDREYADRYRDAQTEQERETIEKEREDFIVETTDRNSDNLFGLYILRSNGHGLQPEVMLAKLDRLPAKYRDMEMARYLRKNAEARLRTSVGRPYPEIELPDAGGNDVKLSSVVGDGKYVLVDFWASWCPPCMAELPYLLEAYDKYHDRGFEIFGVSLDDDRDKWIECIRNNNMDWYHVSALKKWACPAAADYGVNSIPASFLVGPDGTIVAKNLRGKELENALEEFLAETFPVE